MTLSPRIGCTHTVFASLNGVWGDAVALFEEELGESRSDGERLRRVRLLLSTVHVPMAADPFYAFLQTILNLDSLQFYKERYSEHDVEFDLRPPLETGIPSSSYP